MQEDSFEKKIFLVASVLSIILTVVWCVFLGWKSIEHISLALATCCASFGLGSLVGFVFTIFGDEIEPLGKIRDAMIALASGIAGVSIASVGKITTLVGSIQIFSVAPEKISWFSVLFVVVYFIAGFYFMYITRKLILNPALAKSRVALDRIQLSGSVSLIAISLGNILPTGVLLGRSFIDDDMVEGGGKEVEQLRSELYSDEVDTFLNGCENDLKRGVPILPDSISKAALLHYYRTYFEPREVREAQMAKAESWINRALLRDPLDLAFQIKLADIFGLQDRYDEAVSIFERLERNDESPQYVQQWLGYFLLFIEGREREAIRHSLEFHRRFSDEASGLFNAACGYAQLYGIELREKHKSSIATSENRKKCLEILEQAISIDPETKATALKYATADDSFASLSSDKAFHRLTSTTSP